MSDIAPQRDCASRSTVEPVPINQKDKPESMVEFLLGQQAQGYAQNDPVNHPSHYRVGGIETIDVIEAKLSPEELQGYCIGNAIKYLTRRHYKGKPVEDLKKAHWYLSRALGTGEEPSDGQLDVALDRLAERVCAPQRAREWRVEDIPASASEGGQADGK